MELLRWKTIIALLWIIEAAGFSAYMLMRISEGVPLYFSVFWFIPWILAFLSLTLKGSANRWTNFFLGILYAICLVYSLINSAIRGQVAAILVNYILGIGAAALIAWYAWRWPQPEA